MSAIPERVSTIDALRGIACIAVAWFHFTHGNGRFLTDGWLKRSGTYGWLGVDVFFVISGFIIPYSLHRSSYSLQQYGRFLAKRIVRLDPPYLLSIFVVVLLDYASAMTPGFRGTWPHWEAAQLLGHLGYINSVIGKPWINPVFWSLGIEFQYYLLIGLLAPLLVASPTKRWLTTAMLLVPCLFVTRPALICVHLPLFVMGILCFQRKAGFLSAPALVFGLLVAALLAWSKLGVAISAISLLTAVVILSLNFHSRLLIWFGAISYSLYLLHVPIGGRIVNIGARFATRPAAEISVLLAALATSIIGAYILYRLIELPSQQLSSRISYRSGRSCALAPVKKVGSISNTAGSPRPPITL